MSSIAYITDQRLIENVRSSGNRELNFWRLSMKNFESFSEGSLLFFIDSRLQSRNNKEKGIIGFGRATSFQKMSPKKMWETYRSVNGYHDLMSFYDAILSAGKSDEMPKSVQSIYLDSIVIFKGPLYLSEIGVNLPLQLESFAYLDRDNSHNTASLLEKVKEIGIDTWYQALNPKLNIDIIDEHIKEQRIRTALQRVNYNFSKQQYYILSQSNCDFLINCIGYNKVEKGYEILVPCSSIKQQQYAILGIISALKNDITFVDVSFKVIVREKTTNLDLFITQGIALLYI